ncbi:Enoyl-coa hydratase [Globisporangium polare]
MRTLLLRVSAALLLSLVTLSTSPVADGRMIPWSYDLHSKMHRSWSHKSDSERLQDQLDAYIREGRFPKAGRSLDKKIREANAFMERELGNPTTAGVGVSAAIVYKDQVVLSKGYGLRLANDSSSGVTTKTLFQIGSVTKTFVALGIATLVEEGKVAWKDPVTKHLPTLQLFDKYAEKYATIGDLLSMNSGLGGGIDLALVFGRYPTDKDLVAALGNVAPAHSLRSEYEYSNTNFAILGELIESVTGIEWDAFLKQRIWEPLGMTRTFASAFAVKDDNDTSSGHISCGGEVLGPYNLVTSREAQLVTGAHGEKIAAGSVVSSSDDMAKLLRVLLNKGSVDGVEILKSPKLISEMVSGKSVVNFEFDEMFSKGGHHFVPEGNTLAAGYGFDFISHALWGHAYYDKSGDTVLHQTRTGFAPDAQLGVIIMANSQLPTPHGNYIMDHVRSYVMGVFLDVPKDILDLSFAKWRKDDALQPLLPGIPVCGLSFWKNPPVLNLDPSETDAIVGEYVAQDSPNFYGSIAIAKTPENGLELHAGKLIGSLKFVDDFGDDGRVFLWSAGPSSSLLVLTKDPKNSKYSLNLGTLFSQQ